jgi:hypothetical protein
VAQQRREGTIVRKILFTAPDSFPCQLEADGRILQLLKGRSQAIKGLICYDFRYSRIFARPANRRTVVRAIDYQWKAGRGTICQLAWEADLHVVPIARAVGHRDKYRVRLLPAPVDRFLRAQRVLQLEVWLLQKRVYGCEWLRSEHQQSTANLLQGHRHALQGTCIIEINRPAEYDGTGTGHVPWLRNRTRMS